MHVCEMCDHRGEDPPINKHSLLILLFTLHSSLRCHEKRDRHHSLAPHCFPSIYALTLLYAGLIREEENDRLLKKVAAQCLPFMKTLNPSLYMRPGQVWPAFSDGIQAIGHHIIGHGRIWATSEPARGGFLECLLNLFTVSMRSHYATSVLRRHTYLRLAFSGPATTLASTMEKMGLSSGRRKNGAWAGIIEKMSRLTKRGMNEPSAK